MMSRNTEYEFIPTDTTELVDQMIADYENLTGETVMPASPERLMISWVASVVLAERVKGNFAANQNLPSRAIGVNLDALAELYYAQERPAAKPAVCTVRFSISEAQTSAILIPAGTRVTDASQQLYWETAADAYVAIGDTYADVVVRCQTSGTIGNGYAAGQINTIVDVYDYYSGCSNTTESDGGADVASDDELYELLKASMYAYSTAGPRGAYEYHARAVSTEIADVRAVRPRALRAAAMPVYTLSGAHYAFLGGDELDPASLVVYPHGSSTAATLNTDYTVNYQDGLLKITIAAAGALASETQLDATVEVTGAGRVVIYALMDDGTIAGSEIKAAILAACNDETVRPLSDLVSVGDPETVTYNINFTYYIPATASASAVEISSAVYAAVEEYKSWQSARLGRDINPSYLIGLLMKTGIKRCVITSPTYTVLHDGDDVYIPQVASVGSTTIVNGGIENE